MTYSHPKYIKNARRIVIKIGSTTLVHEQTGNIKTPWLISMAEDIMQLKRQNTEVLIVTSGSVACGKKRLNQLGQKLSLPQKQAAAAAGMVSLVQHYQQIFSYFDLTIGQVLLTLEDSENRRRYLNARETLENLLHADAIPLINENDTVATAEIKVGDNDRLAARVAAMASSDLLIMFSDIDGLYTSNPHKDPNAQHIPEIRSITKEMRQYKEDTHSSVGTGGIATKLQAAEICMQAGIPMILCNGAVQHPIDSLLNNGRASLFIGEKDGQNARKSWITSSLKTSASLTINQGAAIALSQGKSLLPVGITAVKGHFQKGDTICVIDENGKLYAKGLVNFNHDDMQKIMGKHSDETEEILGYLGPDEAIHRDNLVMND